MGGRGGRGAPGGGRRPGCPTRRSAPTPRAAPALRRAHGKTQLLQMSMMPAVNGAVGRGVGGRHGEGGCTTRRVRLVREEGRNVSSQYGREGGGGCTRRVALVRRVRRWDRGVDPLGEERRVLRAPQQRWKTATLQTRKRFFGCRTAALRSARAAARLLGVHPARRAARVVRVVERHVVYPPRAVTPARVVRPAVAQVSRHLLGAWKGGARQCGLRGGREWRAL